MSSACLFEGTRGSPNAPARIAERADEDRIERAQQIVAVGRERLVRLQVVVRAPWQVLEVEGASELLADSVQHLHGFRRDVLPDPVAREDRYAHDSKLIAIPKPPLTHNVAKPRVEPRFFISCRSVTMIRAPVQPIG